MRDVLQLTEDDARRVPWKNGRGTTLELCVWPEGASFERGDFDVRVSKAAVDEAGPFSMFAGFDRILVVTSGAGLALTHATASDATRDASARSSPTQQDSPARQISPARQGSRDPRAVDAVRARVRPLEPYRFSGDAITHAELVAGPVSDFNVLTRRGVFTAQVEVVRLGQRRSRETLASAHTFVHVLVGDAIARVGGEEEPFELAAGDTLWAIDTGPGEEMELAGRTRDCVVLIVRIERAHGRDADD